jgi:hypothetical protein
MGAQAYISGEILCRLDDDYGRKRFNEVFEYIPQTKMSLIGASHDGSEYLAMRTVIKDWVNKNIDAEFHNIPLKTWWR